jgi:acid phosphatase
LNIRSSSNSSISPGVTNNAITSQVASGLLRGLFPKSDQIPVDVQASPFDSLEPLYSCPNANALRDGYTTGSKGQVWQQHLTEATSLYDKLDSVSGIEKNDSGGWHVSFDQ